MQEVTWPHRENKQLDCPSNPRHLSYLVDEWTSVSDIGKEYGGRRLTVDEYIAIEDLYVAVVRDIMIIGGIDSLHVAGLEEHEYREHLPGEIEKIPKAFVADVREGRLLNVEDVELCVRSALRENLWCRLTGERGFYVHFGYDYYMYVGFDGDIPVDWTPPEGMFIEDFPSPHWPLDE